MKTKQMSPDMEGVPSLPLSTVKKTQGIPRKDADMVDTAKKVAATWLTNPLITLLWMTSADFEALVNSYSDELGSRLSTGSNRPSQTRTLQDLDKRSNHAVIEVRVYIEKKYKKANAEPQYPRFGMVKETIWRLPRDRNKKIASLKLMIDAIDKDGFNNEEFGKTFWLQVQADYLLAFSTANSTDGDVSIQVALKNDKKTQIKKVMTSVRHVLKGNYPDSYAAEYRQWGWQKEDY